MRLHALVCVLALSAGHFLAAEPSAKEAVAAAAKKLEGSSYAWLQKTGQGDAGGRSWPGWHQGKIDSEGTLVVSVYENELGAKLVRKGDKGAATEIWKGWQSFAELESSEGWSKRRVLGFRSFPAPAEQARKLLSAAKDLRKDGEAWVSELTSEGARMAFGFCELNGMGKAKAAEGWVRFWVKDGALVKYEYHITGLGSWEQLHDQKRSIVVELSEAGTAKVTIPEAAKKKLI